MKAALAPYLLEAEGFSAVVMRKPIRGLRMTLRPGDGVLRVSAPLRAQDSDIRDFIVSHRKWIMVQRERLAQVAACPACEYCDGETLALWGGEVTLRVRSGALRAMAALEAPDVLGLKVRRGATVSARRAAVMRFYALEMLKAVGRLLPALQTAMGVEVKTLKVRAMRSRWGSCNARSATVTLALELARRPLESMEYVLTHELAHLKVRSHGIRFKSILDRHLPDWRARRGRLNQKGIES